MVVQARSSRIVGDPRAPAGRAPACALIFLVCTIVALVLLLLPQGVWLEERLGLSLLFHLRGAREPPPYATVVAIDKTALEAMDLRPSTQQVPRSLHARAIERLASAGAAVIVFDLGFVRDGPAPEEDVALAAAMRRAGMVVLLDMLEPLGSADTHGEILLERLVRPAPLFRDAAAAHGPFPLPKFGRVLGWWLEKPAGSPTLPLLAAMQMSRGHPVAVPDEQARYLDFYGPPRTITTIGFQDVLVDDAASRLKLQRAVAGRVVFIGHSAMTSDGQDRVRDYYDTVFTGDDGTALSGVEIAATALTNMLEGRQPRHLPLGGQALLAMAWAIALAVVCTFLATARATVCILAAAAAYLGLAHLMFQSSALWLPLVVPLLVVLPLTFLLGIAWQGLAERRLRRRYALLVDDLLPPQIVAHLARRLPRDGPAELEVSGVFLMTDLAGFTSMAEREDPLSVSRRLNAYFALIFPAVERHGGNISQINGDAVLAFWLTSGHNERGARLAACRAALEIDALTSRSDSPAAMPTRIGIHAGPVAIARLGAGAHHEYRAVGDAANTASRLESMSKQLGTRVLASEHVVEGLHELLTRPIGSFLLAGKAAPLGVHEIVASSDATSDAQRHLCALFAEGLSAFQGGRWEEASNCWRRLAASFPGDGPTTYFSRITCHNDSTEPPLDWDGVVRLSEK